MALLSRGIPDSADGWHAGVVWFDYLGLQSSGHGAAAPDRADLLRMRADHEGFSDWTTIKEELYNTSRSSPARSRW